ncbi:MAG: hypothetical protein EBZ48_09395 [Proteobacteria bacterium]|nr:hypothetical protein [Pseudomonadota bacterium]
MKKLLSVALLFGLIPALAQAAPSAESAREREAESIRASLKPETKLAREAIKTIRDATAAYEDIVFKGPKGEVPKSIQDQAKCIAVFPHSVTAAIVVGGMHGKGVVSCKNNNVWSSPTLATLSGASVGAQVGGKSTDYVFFINSAEAVSKIKTGKLDVNADAGFVMGSYDASATTSSAGVLGYQKSGGGYMGASLGASTITLDEASNKEVYGKEFVAVNLLDGVQIGQHEAATEFLKKLPKA